MPVNLRGGKGFKKGKKGGGAGEDDSRPFIGRTAGQDYARVIRLLGNRRVLCFCNDGVERMCRIRGALCRGPKKQIIGVSDVVLYSLRDLSSGGSDDEGGADTVAGAGVTKEIGDIIYKYDAKEFRHIRKEVGIHRLLLAAESTRSGGAAVDDDIFDREEDERDDCHDRHEPPAPPAPAEDAEIDIDAI